MISPPSDYPVTKWYLAVVNSSIDAILIMDRQAGRGIVSHVVLHDRLDDNDIDKWLKPLSVATCDSCKHITVISKNILYVINLDRPLKDMADDHNF
jgi:hypothetical protein